MGSAAEGGKEGRSGKAPDKEESAEVQGSDTGFRGTENLLRTLDHRRRREIMRLLHAADGPLSQYEICDGLEQALASACHHIHVLRQRGVIALVTADERGEFYVSRVEDQAAVRIFLDEAQPF